MSLVSYALGNPIFAMEIHISIRHKGLVIANLNHQREPLAMILPLDIFVATIKVVLSVETAESLEAQQDSPLEDWDR